MPAPEDKQKDALLEAFLGHAVFDGWTDGALDAAARDVGISPAMARNVFAGGLLDVAAHFSATADRAMLAALAGVELASMRVRDRIALGVRKRIEAIVPHREAVRHLVGYLALPGHQGASAKCAWQTASEIWYAAGDTAADFNHYTKRGLLVGVYGATMLYWLADESDGFTDTWAFLDRRIDDVLQVTSLKGKLEKAVKEGFSGMKTPADALRGFTRRARGGLGGFTRRT